MDIHRRNGVLEWILRRIDDEIPETNRAIIHDFDYDLIAKGLSVATRATYLAHLFKMAKHLGTKPFDGTSKDDVRSYITHCEGNGYSVRTRENIKRVVIRFYTWLGRREYVSDIRTMTKSQLYALTVPEAVLNKRELRAIISGGRNILEKAFLALLSESGARTGEILTLRTSSVDFDKIGAKMTVNGKTGKRTVRILRCKCNHPDLAVNLLSRLIDYEKTFVFEQVPRPAGKDGLTRAYIDEDFKAPGLGKPFSYQFVRHLFERIRKSGATNKRVHAHLFRHSRATMFSPWFSYTQLCDHFGWKYGSKMPAIYIRSNNSSLDNAMLKAYHMKPVRPESLCLWCGPK